MTGPNNAWPPGFLAGPPTWPPGRVLPCAVDGNPCFSLSGRHRPRGPTTRHQSISANCLVVNVVVYVSNSERKQRARKPPLRGGWGVNLKPSLRIVGVVGGDYMLKQARDKWVRSHFLKKHTHRAHTVYTP